MALAAKENAGGATPQATKSNFVVVADRYLIDPKEPLEEFDSPTAKAYMVRDRDDPERPLFALVCTPSMPVRLHAAMQVRNHEPRNNLPLIEWDTIYWPPIGRWTIAIVFQRPTGGRLIDIMSSKEGRISEYDLPKRVIDPIVHGLRSINAQGVAHRAIRPWNLYFLDAQQEELVLGECYSTPAGYDQPLVFEPVDRGMALQAGRGEGDLSDDYYAMGVTIVMLALGTNPVAKMKSDAILTAKVERGTFGLLCGEKIPVALIEPLRGLLNDDSDLRWSSEQMDLWLGGSHKAPVQKSMAKKADFPYKFVDIDHLTGRMLGHALTRNITEGGKRLRDGSVETWVRRGLKDGTRR